MNDVMIGEKTREMLLGGLWDLYQVGQQRQLLVVVQLRSNHCFS